MNSCLSWSTKRQSIVNLPEPAFFFS